EWKNWIEALKNCDDNQWRLAAEQAPKITAAIINGTSLFKSVVIPAFAGGRPTSLQISGIPTNTPTNTDLIIDN
ncbi:hypothetical protein BGX20_007562, partial [Mortierella sp. AD010]